MNKGFQKDFLWGGAVAAHQVEGGYNKRWERYQYSRCNDRRKCITS